jgi:heat-inducible transcriptional repressor
VALPPHAPRLPPLELDERARRVLSAVVQDHIEVGEPVGSRAVAARDARLDVSSATVRAVMADLEALGLLEKPHTSAGRIPTAAGYRYYVDALLKVQAVPPEQQQLIERRTQQAAGGLDSVLAETTRLLHGLTRQASVVAAPRPQSDRLERIEFIPLREGRVLAVLVTRSGTVQNRLLVTPPGEPPLSVAQLGEAQAWLNGLLGDLTLEEARVRLQETLELDKLLAEAARREAQARALRLGVQAVALQAGPELHIEGHSALLADPAMAQDVARLRALLEALEEKGRVIAVLDRALASRELTIFIGAESGLGGEELSVIAAPYRFGGGLLGTLGVIGPTRMDYARVVPLVELTARSLGAALGQA